MNIPPDAAELKALWQKGHPVLPIPEDAREKLLTALGGECHWIGRLNAARLSPLFGWSDNDREIVIDLLLVLRSDENRFVGPWALGALWEMVPRDDPRGETVEAWLTDALASGSAGERARARLLLAQEARGTLRRTSW
ncbi:hypothetical protein EON82_14185 [bacterium]|nr:MAG: hypothetical protein EON82_14185 [bacterium]